jgi:cobalamin biosynthetic protein CobC
VSVEPLNPPLEALQPLHGGDIIQASAVYGLPTEQWIDLSTGINPQPYPINAPDPRVYQRLPYLLPELMTRAAAYYGHDRLLPVPGSQAVIQHLPACLPQRPVLAPEPGYQEHAMHWRKRGEMVATYPAFDAEAAADCIDAALRQDKQRHLVIINPNNPSGLQFPPEQLVDWSQQLSSDSYLIVDEAFMDLTPAKSVLGNGFTSNMIVLRSFGKFFGLAGIRLGFVFANRTMLQALQAHTGLWAVNGPAQAIAIDALQDQTWQQAARENIGRCSELTRQLFAPLFADAGAVCITQQPLFSTWKLDRVRALMIYDFFLRHGILLRLIELSRTQSLLRVGVLNAQDPERVERVQKRVDACKCSRLPVRPD